MEDGIRSGSPPARSGPRPPEKVLGLSSAAAWITTRQAFYVLGALAAVIAYLGYHGQEAVGDYRQSAVRRDGGTAVVVPPGRTGDLAGADWQLVSIGAAPSSSRRQPPPGTAVVNAVISVTPRDQAAQERIADCGFRARDAKGRVWEPNSAFADRSAFPGTAIGCRAPGFGSEPLPPGSSVQVLVSFLVPRDAVDSLQPEVRMQSLSSTEYLRFAR